MNVYIRGLKSMDKKDYVNEGNGFYLLVRPTGVKNFYIRYTHDGKEKFKPLGVCLGTAAEHDATQHGAAVFEGAVDMTGYWKGKKLSSSRSLSSEVRRLTVYVWPVLQKDSWLH
jgi:hypothetical protein